MAVARAVHVGSIPAPSSGLVDPATPAGQKPASHPSWPGGLLFSDEFAGTAVDAARWIPTYPPAGQYPSQALAGHLSNGHGPSPSDGSADEPQIYHASALSVADSVLTMTMTDGVPAEYSGESWYPAYDFTSGMICSWPAFALPGGYFEARMRCDAVPGAWPAFWALSSNLEWPPEVDVVEYWGDSPSWAQYGGYQVGSGSIGAGGHPITGTMAAWQTFGCRYLPGESVSFYCNGTLSGTRAITFDDDLFLILNLAGDHRPGMSPSPAAMPFSAQVDWVRAWAAA